MDNLDYAQERQASTYQFQQYRTTGEPFDRNTDTEYLNTRVPTPGPHPIFTPGRLELELEQWRPEERPNLEAVYSEDQLRTTVDSSWWLHWTILQDIRWYFGQFPHLSYVRYLSLGRKSICVLYTYTNPETYRRKNFVVKWPLDPNVNVTDLRSWDLQHEEIATRKMHRSRHCIQLLRPEDVGLPDPRNDPTMPTRPQLERDDSTDGEHSSSGDDSVVERRPRRMDTHQTKQNEWTVRNAALRSQWNTFLEEKGAQGTPYRHFLLFEYLENNSLDNLIIRMNEANRTLPNRILWSFWLCMVRACVAMAYPPRKFNPGRRGRRDVLTETIPDSTFKTLRMKQFVHFGLDPSNVFIGAPNPGSSEHNLIPKLKLGDFGDAREIKKNKTDAYYQRKRGLGKHGYFAPEQFSAQWDKYDTRAEADDLGRRKRGDVAANFGSGTNVWGIANIMFSLITGCHPPTPPQPEMGPPLIHGLARFEEQHITYGKILLSDQWNHVDKNLRITLVKCMNHHPSDRPSLYELLAEATEGHRKEIRGETDRDIEAWVRWITLNPYVFHSRPATQKVQDSYTAVFPNRRRFIPQDMNDIEHGFRAIIASIEAQDPTQTAPSMGQLRELHDYVQTTMPQRPPKPFQAHTVEQLGILVYLWGHQEGIHPSNLNLQLGVVENVIGSPPQLSYVETPDHNPFVTTTIWINLLTMTSRDGTKFPYYQGLASFPVDDEVDNDIVMEDVYGHDGEYGEDGEDGEDGGDGGDGGDGDDGDDSDDGDYEENSSEA
ncbi:kinase-like domain-containing protein [Whalleya microplaca]|nr:kinase-like domain-containing protein [Whalleya microplaca]